MQILLASAKIMNASSSVEVPLMSDPTYREQANKFALELSSWDIKRLMKEFKCSQEIALENQQRYQSFWDKSQQQPAILAYFGQAYKYLKAETFSQENFTFAQEHLFSFWKPLLTDMLIEAVKKDDSILVHLATEEFEHLFDWKRVNIPISSRDKLSKPFKIYKTMEIGQKLPEVLGIDQDGKKWMLAELSGKKVVLYIYPRDSTPGCTNEACNLRDNYERFLAEGYVVIGVSTQDAKSHKKFIEKNNLPFPLICDTEKVLVNELGVFGEKKMCGRVSKGVFRTTFIADETGTITRIIGPKEIKVKEHATQILG